MTFSDWYHRHLQAPDPMEPASPPPFKEGERVVVSSSFEDGAFLDGYRGVVVAVEFTTNTDDPFGPWVIRVMLDNDKTPTKFHADELTREGEHTEPTEPPTVTVTQPEDIDTPVPYVPTGEVPADGVQHWIQRAKELRHETPVYDDVAASAMARDGLAAEVEAYLAEVAAGGAA